VKIAVAASPEVAIPTLEYLLASQHELALIISRPDNQVGRGREITQTAVSTWAIAHGIELYRPNKAADFDERLKNYDLVITIGYGVLLPEFILSQPKHGFINLHFSLLPKLRGAAPAQRAIIEGFTETGVTVFQLDAGMDTGPIYRQKEIAMPDKATTSSLLEDLAAIGAPVVLDAIKAIEANEIPVIQSEIGRSRAEKLSKDEGRIDWQLPATKIERKIRAFYPAPGAWTTFRDEAIRIESAQTNEAKSGQLGELLLEGKELFVCTAEGSLQIFTVKPAGKASMPAMDWVNGARIEPEARFK